MNSKLIAGQVLQGRYRVVRLLGEGGYGAVYLVQDARLGGKYLALKESFHSSPEAQQQFQLEANLLAGLSHPHLPRVSDYFIEPSGRQYLVMDFIEGQDLAELLVQRRAPLPEGQAVTWMLQVCQAVAHLHSCGFTDPALYHNLGLACIMAKRYPEAIAILEQGTAQFADGDIAYQLGQAYALNGQLAESARVLEQAVRLQPQDAANRVLLGMVLQDQGQHQQAIAVLEQAVRLQRDEAFAHYLLGKSYLFTDQFERAEKSFAEAVRLDPDDADHHYYLGLARLERKRPDAAVSSFRQALKLEADHYLAHYFLGEAYLKQDDYQEAARWFERAAALDPSDPDPHIGLAVCYALLKRRTDAITAVRRALAIDPHNQQARDLLGKL
ncbi:MAG: tetratricopeptide repeat protein [Anaerolineae bacterium]|nr:tetratricopeptide repeat protein [Anaerolineae bacterium]